MCVCVCVFVCVCVHVCVCVCTRVCVFVCGRNRQVPSNIRGTFGTNPCGRFRHAVWLADSPKLGLLRFHYTCST